MTRAERGRRAPREVRVEDEVADDDRGAGDLAARVVGPAHASRARVEGVEAAVVGADVDRRPGAGHAGHGGRGVDVVAGPVAPGELAVGGREGVDEAVERADVDAPVGRRRRRVEAPGLQPERRAGARRLPDRRAVALADGVHLAAVVAEEQAPLVERQPALDRAGRLVAPAQRAVAGAQRVDGAVLGPEVDAPAGHQRRGLRARGQLARPAHAPVLGVERHHAPGLDPLPAREHDRVDAGAGARRRRGGQVAELRLPAHPAGQAADLVSAPLFFSRYSERLHSTGGNSISSRPETLPLLHERGPQRRLERQVARARLRVAVVRPREAVVHRVIGGLRLVLGARGARGLRVGELDVGVARRRPAATSRGSRPPLRRPPRSTRPRAPASATGRAGAGTCPEGSVALCATRRMPSTCCAPTRAARGCCAPSHRATACTSSAAPCATCCSSARRASSIWSSRATSTPPPRAWRARSPPTTASGPRACAPRTAPIDLVRARAESYAHPGALPDVRPGTLDEDLQPPRRDRQRHRAGPRRRADARSTARSRTCAPGFCACCTTRPSSTIRRASGAWRATRRAWASTSRSARGRWPAPPIRRP